MKTKKSVLREIIDNRGQMLFYCPACKMAHFVNVAPKKKEDGPVWEWNGSMAHPTFKPSIRVRYQKGFAQTKEVCHFFVRKGRIEYLADCTHSMAGQTIQMIPVDIDEAEDCV